MRFQKSKPQTADLFALSLKIFHVLCFMKNILTSLFGDGINKKKGAGSDSTPYGVRAGRV